MTGVFAGQRGPDRGDPFSEGCVRPRGESGEEALACRRDPSQRRACIGDHRADVEAARGEVEHLEGLGEVGVEFEELVQQVLWDFVCREVQLIERPEEREQVETGGFDLGLDVPRYEVTNALHGEALCPMRSTAIKRRVVPPMPRTISS